MVLGCIAICGLAVGSIKFKGIGLGIAGVLFAGILTGYVGNPIDYATLEYVKEFGLVLFIFTIGLQLGPGFIASLRQQCLTLNALAAAVVALGVLVALTLGWLLGLDAAAVLGLLAGATTNTPSLGAVQQTLTTLPGVSPDRQELPAPPPGESAGKQESQNSIRIRTSAWPGRAPHRGRPAAATRRRSARS